MRRGSGLAPMAGVAARGVQQGGAESHGGRGAGLGGRSGWERRARARSGDWRSGQVFRGESRGLRVCWNLALLT